MKSFFSKVLLSAPKIVKRRDWGASELLTKGNFAFRRLIREVKIVRDEDKICDTMVVQIYCDYVL